jgi:hypothetical protein
LTDLHAEEAHPMRRRSALAIPASLAAAPAVAQVATLVPPNAQPDGNFGRVVAPIRDVNGDGFGDVAVGAPGENPPSAPAKCGRGYIVSGASGAILRTLSSPGQEPNGGFGSSIAGIPDVNGDGFGDVVVGAPYENPGASPVDCGRAYVYSGASGVLLYKLKAPIQQANAQFGWSVAGLADVTGDGRGDVAVGANFDNAPGNPGLSGVVYVFSGATGAYLRALVPPAPVQSAQFGWSVAAVPDANGDGRPDILVGAPFDGPVSLPFCGRAYLFSGATGQHLRTLASPGQQALGYFGFSVAGLADADGDGKGDLVIGAPGDAPGTSPQGAGRAYVYSGRTGQLLLKLLPPHSEQDGKFGYSVGALADVNNDGRGDIVVGAPNVDPGTSPDNSGYVYIFSGANGTRLRSIAPPTPQLGGRFGAGVAGVRNFGGDSRDDLAVGADTEQADGKPVKSGRVYLIRY